MNLPEAIHKRTDEQFEWLRWPGCAAIWGGILILALVAALVATAVWIPWRVLRLFKKR